jgi:hypothetical protein
VSPRACTLVCLTLTAALSWRIPRSTARETPIASPTWTFPKSQRLVAIGDLHGDLAAARRALVLAGAIDAKDRWTGGKLVVVQTGDQLDRGDDERELLALLERLQTQAAHAGGRLLVLNGNHELMNVAGDFRYVTRRGFEAYADSASDGRTDLASGRSAAFAPGGPIARQLAKHPVIATVGSTLFVHGGVLPAHLQYGIERINREASAFMLGAQAKLSDVLTAEDSPVWTRAYSQGTPSAAACAQLREVLERTHMRRMVVGHTVQGEINSACDKQVWRIDVGLSAHYGGPTQVLDLRDDVARVLRAKQGVSEPAVAH